MNNMAGYETPLSDHKEAGDDNTIHSIKLLMELCGGVFSIEQAGRARAFDLDDAHMPFVRTKPINNPRFSLNVQVEFGKPAHPDGECAFELEYIRAYSTPEGYLFNTIPCTPNPSWDHPDRTLFWGSDCSTFRLIRDDAMPIRHSLYPLYSKLDRLVVGGFLPANGIGFLAHSSAVADGNSGLLFLGPCGRGKSTMARIWTSAAGATILSDECSGVCTNGSSWLLHGTPWPSTARGYSDKSVPLKAIFILEHGHTDECSPVIPGNLFTAMLNQALIPHWDQESVRKLHDMLSELSTSVPAALLRFRPYEEVIPVIREFAESGG